MIPAFAVGRTQEMVYNLNRMITNEEVPSIPVYVDSQLAVNASDIFRRFSDYFDDETKEFVLRGKHPALWFDRLVYVRSVEESKALNKIKEPCVIISASGMVENGRIRHHLCWAVEDPNNSILIVSWQAPNTLGRKLAERVKEIQILGETYERRAEVETIGGLSARAGQSLLVEYPKAANRQAKHIFHVHGEKRAAEAMGEKFMELGVKSFSYPPPYEVPCCV